MPRLHAGSPRITARAEALVADIMCTPMSRDALAPVGSVRVDGCTHGE